MEPLPPGAAAVIAEDRAEENPEDGAAESMVEGEPIAEPVRDGEHPLPDGDGGEHLLDEIRRPLGHPPPATAGAHRPRLTRERDEPFEGAALAPHTKKTVDEEPAAEEGPELPFDKGRQPRPVGARGGRGEEVVEVIAHDAMEYRRVGGARGVCPHATGGSAFRAAPETSPGGAWTGSAAAPRP